MADSAYSTLLFEQFLVLLTSDAVTNEEVAIPYLVGISIVSSLVGLTAARLAPPRSFAVLIDVKLVGWLLLTTLRADESLHVDRLAEHPIPSKPRVIGGPDTIYPTCRRRAR